STIGLLSTSWNDSALKAANRKALCRPGGKEIPSAGLSKVSVWLSAIVVFLSGLGKRLRRRRRSQTATEGPERSALPLGALRPPGEITTSSRIHRTVAIDLKRIYPLIEDLAQRPARRLTRLLDAPKPRQ